MLLECFLRSWKQGAPVVATSCPQAFSFPGPHPHHLTCVSTYGRQDVAWRINPDPASRSMRSLPVIGRPLHADKGLMVARSIGVVHNPDNSPRETNMRPTTRIALLMVFTAGALLGCGAAAQPLADQRAEVAG